MWRRILAGNTSTVAAGCAFYATLALFPGLTMLISLYGLIFDPVTVVPQMNLLRDVLPPETYDLIDHQVHALVTHPRVDLRLNVIISLVITLWSASTGTKSILAAIATAYHGNNTSVVRFQLTGLAMTLCAILGAVLAIAILVALPQLLNLMGTSPVVQFLLHTSSLAVLMAFVWASIAALYHFGPRPRLHPEPRVLPGALTATVLWLATSVLFTVYVGRIANFDTTYGPLAAVAGVMLWFWVTTYVVLLGAELNAALTQPA